MHRFGTIRELLQMLVQRRTWILLPPVLALLLIAGLIAVGSVTPLGPLIYPLF